MPIPRFHYFNPVTLAERVDELIAQHGSIRKAARVLEVDHAHLFRVKKGEKQPSDDLLRRMGLTRHVHYTRLGEKQLGLPKSNSRRYTRAP